MKSLRLQGPLAAVRAIRPSAGGVPHRLREWNPLLDPVSHPDCEVAADRWAQARPALRPRVGRAELPQPSNAVVDHPASPTACPPPATLLPQPSNAGVDHPRRPAPCKVAPPIPTCPRDGRRLAPCGAKEGGATAFDSGAPGRLRGPPAKRPPPCSSLCHSESRHAACPRAQAGPRPARMHSGRSWPSTIAGGVITRSCAALLIPPRPPIPGDPVVGGGRREVI